jgi:hypothetical protein
VGIHSSLNSIAKSNHFIVRFCEERDHHATAFQLEQFAENYACGQRNRPER